MEITTWFGRIDLEIGELVRREDELSKNEISILSRQESQAYPLPQPDLRRLSLQAGIFPEDSQYNCNLRQYAISLAKRKLEESAGAEQDLLMAMQALDGMSQAINLLDERLYEWSRLHRQEIVHGRSLAEGLKQDRNMGRLAGAIIDLRESRKSMEDIVSEAVQSLAPNLSALAGPILAARLVSRAGGLSRLAAMPSSRLQVMGAERSLFKHLKGHAPSPKHGIIYRHPAVIGSPRRLRGRAARALAAKLAIAARLDANEAGLSQDLRDALEARLIQIRQKGIKR
ncbi:MAG TPA: ATP-binding protein [Methanothrix sp.]|nr:ATP-binding protein [Methanothrix sp.]HOU70145.1 ATP-binding protein [Methanothrix sp.]HQE97413.1 ATP-binding protein [Methanothrix sp.]HQJ79286.1 ATP-binding protein [Methanothrix sp.]HUM80410.1 ATP-binding protein [Methanothrix sp.]